ncbi:hypothetical protein [Modestobacter sp. SYSU DS0875]
MAWWGWVLLGSLALLSIAGVRWLGAAAAVVRQRECQAQLDELLAALDATAAGGQEPSDGEVSGGSPAAPRR